MDKKAFLIIMDGWGIGDFPDKDAIYQAETPYYDQLIKDYPNAKLLTHGHHVGLPDGQMGNSEVGHLNIGAGRVVYQELARINKEIEDNSLASNQTILDMIAHAKAENVPIHLMGLLSDGGVHSHLDHIIAICDILSNQKVKVFIHAFLDGRDTDPNGGADYLRKLLKQINTQYCSLSSVIGRYYAMDRDNRWERIQKAYQLLVRGKGTCTNDIIQTIESFYEEGITDEFMEPIKVGSTSEGLIKEKDVAFFANFRTDRPRQLTQALTQTNFPEYELSKLDLYFVTMTEYDAHFSNIRIVFTKENLINTLGEIISANNKTQLRIAETEKYPHVTFFFSGGREEAFPGESRIMVPSPKVATYDLKPEMSAQEMTVKVIDYIKSDCPDCIIMNYANTDMVGHTGVFKAAIKAAETVDSCLSQVVPLAIQHNYTIIIIADHGNSDYMINEDGSPNTAHTTNPVPVIVVNKNNQINQVENGALCNIAPTILKIMGIPAPSEMTAKPLF